MKEITGMMKSIKKFSSDYLIIDMQLKKMNIAFSSSYTSLMKHVDELILSQYNSTLIVQNNKGKNKSNDSFINYIKFRLSRFEIDLSDDKISLLDTFIQRKLGNKSKSAFEILNTVIDLFKSDSFKYLYDYFPYKEVIYSKLLISFPEAYLPYQKNDFLFSFKNKPIYLVNIYSNNDYLKTEFIASIQNNYARIYNLEMKFIDEFKDHKTKYFLNDVQNFLANTNKVNIYRLP